MPSVECYNAMVLQNGLQEFVIGVDCTGIVTSIRIEEAGRAYSALVIGKTRVQVPCKDQLISIREGGQSAIQKLEPGTSSFFGVCVCWDDTQTGMHKRHRALVPVETNECVEGVQHEVRSNQCVQHGTWRYECMQQLHRTYTVVRRTRSNANLADSRRGCFCHLVSVRITIWTC